MMDHNPERLTEELGSARRRIAELEAAVARCTARVRELEASEARYRSLIEQIPAVAYSLSLASADDCYVSPRIESLLGCTTEALRGDPRVWRERVHPEDAPRVRAGIEQALATGRFECEYRVLTFDGRTIWVRDAAVVIRGEDGRPLSIRGALVDVTDSKQTEQALRESEAKYRAAVECCADGINIVQADRVVFANSALAEMMGWPSAEDMIGMDFTGFVAPEQRQAVRETGWARERGEKVPVRYEFTAMRKDGTRFEAEVSVSLIPYQGGIARQAVIRDISARKRAAEELARSERIYRKAIEAAQGVPYQIDIRTRRYSFIGQDIRDLTGLAAEDLDWDRFQSLVEEVIPIDPAAPRSPAEYACVLLQGERPFYRADIRIRKPDGTTVWLNDSAVPLRDPTSGEMVGLLGILQDITPRKRVEEALQQAHRELEHRVEERTAELRVSREAERTLRMYLTSLLEVTNELSRAETFDDLCRTAVELGRDRLGFDRLGLWWLGQGGADWLEGSFGTDETGRTRDERGRRIPTDPERRALLASLAPGRVLRVDPATLTDDAARPIGRGTLLWTTIWDGERTTGALFADNALRGQPLTEEQASALALFAASLGHLASRKKSEERLRLLSSAVEQTAEGVAIADLDHRILFANAAFASLHGYTPDELRGQPIALFHTPDQMPQIQEILEHVRAGGEWRGELDHRRRDGTMFPTLMHVTALRDRTGRPTALIGTMTDITDRKQAEENLRESERKYRTLAEVSTDAIFLETLDGRILDCNSRACEIFGYAKKDELIGRTIADLVPEDVAPWLSQIVAREPEFGQLLVEARGRRRDGAIFPSEVSACLVELGGRPHVVAYVRDVTARKQAEEARREVEQRYRLLAESAEDLIYIIDAELRIEYANRACAGFLRRPPEQIIGRSFVELFPADMTARQEPALRAVLQTGQPLSIENPFTKDDQEHWLDTRLVPIRHNGGTVRGVLGISRDVGRYKRLEAELRESQRALTTLMSNLPGMAYRCRNDPQWTMQFVSSGALDLTGYPPEALIENRDVSYGDLIHPDDRPTVWDRVQAALGERRPFEIVYRIRTADGNQKWVWEQGRGVFGESGELLALEGFIADITAQKRAEAALAESENRFRVMTESALTGVYVIQEGVFRYVNPALAAAFGYEPREIIDRLGPVDLTVPEDRPIVVEQVRRRMDGDVDWVHYSFGGLRKDGARIECEVLGRRVSYQGRPAIIGTLLDVTQRKRAEAALRDERNLVTAILETAGALIIVLDRDGRIVRFNRTCEQVTGRSFDEVRGRYFWEVVLPPEEVEAVRQVFDNIREGNYPNRYENHWIDVEGRRHLIAWCNSAIPDETGAPQYIIGTGIDVSESRRAEEALREERNLVSAILDIAGALIMVTDLDGRIVRFNRACEQLTGYRYESVAGRPFWELVLVPDEVENVRRAYGELRSGRYPIDQETCWVGADGRQRLISWSSTLLADAEGRPRYVVNVGVDITDRRRAEAALRESEERYRTILDQMQEAVIFADEHDIIRHINSFACSLLGVSREAAIGRNLLSLHTEDLRPRVAEMVGRLRSESQWHAETIRRTLGDRELVLRFSPVHAADGSYRGVIANLVDITEQVRMQQQLAEARRMETIGTLAGGVAHDFNNLMTTVLGMASILKSRRRSDHPDYPYLVQIEDAAATAGRLAHQLLIFAKGGKILPRLVEFPGVVQHALAVVQPSVPANVEVRSDVPSDLWPVECDAGQVEQVIINLCRNAIDAMPEGGRLSIRAMNTEVTRTMDHTKPPLSPGKYVTVLVQDTGCGMDPETVSRVFDPFFTTKAGGYGLGLAAAYGIVRSHGGAIAVSSEPGKGSTFQFWLPRAHTV